MNRAVTVPAHVRSAFAAALRGESPHAGALPDPLPIERTLHVIDRARGSTDELTVVARRNETGYFLDFFRVGNNGETCWHGRIREDGTVETLENYQGQYGFPDYPDDPARTKAEENKILEHNARVRAILKAKGFE
jgi:hypothetical protein